MIMGVPLMDTRIWLPVFMLPHGFNLYLVPFCYFSRYRPGFLQVIIGNDQFINIITDCLFRSITE